MILSIWRFLRNFAWYHHVMIFITVLLPFIWPWIPNLGVPEYVANQPIYRVSIFLVFWLLVLWSVGRVLHKDRSKVEESVSQAKDDLQLEIRELRDEHQELIRQHGALLEDHQRQISYQNDVFRSAFRELGVPLPGLRISLRAGSVSFNVAVSNARVFKKYGSKRARFRQFCRRFAIWLKKTIWG